MLRGRVDTRAGRVGCARVVLGERKRKGAAGAERVVPRRYQALAGLSATVVG
jgi:hypothetical protein